MAFCIASLVDVGRGNVRGQRSPSQRYDILLFVQNLLKCHFIFPTLMHVIFLFSGSADNAAAQHFQRWPGYVTEKFSFRFDGYTILKLDTKDKYLAHYLKLCIVLWDTLTKGR